MNTTFYNSKLTENSKFSNENYLDYDFSFCDFNKSYFVNSNFENCIFQKGKSLQLAFFNCRFKNCKFINFDFRSIPVGADGGVFSSCHFLSCNFKGRQFEYPHFDLCLFDKCILKNINFNDASFYKTKFIGKLEDVTFNGLYHKKSSGFKIIDYVDFSDAILGEFVTFENCDLSTSVPPMGTQFSEFLYQIKEDSPHILSTGSRDKVVIK